MKSITFHLDFISPYAYLAFEALPETLRGLEVQVIYRPVLFAGLLKHYGQLGPAEIAPKRHWTYRQVLWLARQHSIALEPPASHPFNPLALLRLALACEATAPHSGAVSREVCETLFRHVWRGGAVADDPDRLRSVTSMLAPVHSPESADVKAGLKNNTDAAIAQGVFGVPTFMVDNELFWGFDALPLLRSYLQDDPFFNGPWQVATQVGAGVVRRG
jgi:2-hydroxychromene-2-carboxylate isomerase